VEVGRRSGRDQVGLYRADSEAQLDGLLGALPLSEWMHITVMPLEAHPNDPAAREPAMSTQLPVDASEYTFRTSTQIETAAPDLDWLNKGIFISVAGRPTGRVIYETYLVG
jgi:hypothetical protein